MNRRRVPPIFLAFLIGFLFACSSSDEQEPESQSITIEGILNIDEAQYIYLTSSEAAQDFKNYTYALDSCWVDTAGDFSFSVKSTESDFYQIRNSNGYYAFYNKDLYLGPGQSLNILQTEDTLILSGEAAELNQIQWDLSFEFYEEDSIDELYSSINYMMPEEFESFMEEHFKGQESRILSFDLPDSYANYLIAKARYDSWKDYYRYLSYHKYYAFGEFGSLPADSVDFSFLGEWQADSEFNFILAYTDCIAGIVDTRFEETTIDLPDSIRWEISMAEKFSIAKNSFDGVDRDIAMAWMAKDFWLYLTLLKTEFYPVAEEMYDYFSSNYSDEKYLDLFSDYYIGFRNIAPGETAPDFTFPDLKDELVSLSDFKGNLVYIDFWGTWGGPCIQSIPYHKELQESLKDRDDMVFMYVSLEYGEEDIKRWKEFVAEEDWPGVHLVADKQFNNPQLAPYKINAAPTYMLIDENGNIVSPRANGPENVMEELDLMLDKLY